MYQIKFSRHSFGVSLIFIFLICMAVGMSAAWPVYGDVIVTPTTNTGNLETALNPTGLTITSVNIINGVSGQFGTYTNFTTPPITIGDGVVLSSGNVSYLTPLSGFPDNIMGSSGTTEFDAYGSVNIENFDESFNVAALQVNFNLATSNQIKFDFVFGSVEYPDYISSFTDAFLVFLDGTGVSNQITFDNNGDPIQVGLSFSGLVSTADQNTVFTDPYGVLPTLVTTSALLSAGNHTLLFEIGDVNDEELDSAVFIANLRTGTGEEGTQQNVPEPGTTTMAFGAIGFAFLSLIRRWRRQAA